MSYILISGIFLLISLTSYLFYTLPDISKKPQKYSKLKYILIKIKHYIINTNHPLVLIVYCIISPGCYLLYLEYIQNKFYNIIPYEFIITVNLFCLIGFLFYFKCVISNPGKVTEHNHEKFINKYNNFYDGIIFIKNNKCKTCDFIKPARSRHCKYCNLCINKNDHHCFWYFKKD